MLIEAPLLQDSRFNAYASASRKFGFSNASIHIKSASYGTAMGVRCAQRIDVRSVLQHRVDNSLRNDFSIGIEENLDHLFGCRMSPWEGCELRINFEINSFVIRMDLPVRNMKLGCEVRFYFYFYYLDLYFNFTNLCIPGNLVIYSNSLVYLLTHCENNFTCLFFKVRLGYLVRPIMSPSPVDNSAAIRHMLGVDTRKQTDGAPATTVEQSTKREMYGKGSGRPPASRWVGTFDQPKTKASKYALVLEEEPSTRKVVGGSGIFTGKLAENMQGL